MENINALLAFGKVVVLSNGREQKINPFKFKQFGEVLNAVKGLDFKMLEGEVDMIGLVTDHYEKILQVVKLTTGWAQEEIDELYADDVAKLVFAIIEVNKDFFVQRLAPSLQNLQMSSPGAS